MPINEGDRLLVGEADVEHLEAAVVKSHSNERRFDGVPGNNIDVAVSCLELKHRPFSRRLSEIHKIDYSVTAAGGNAVRVLRRELNVLETILMEIVLVVQLCEGRTILIGRTEQRQDTVAVSTS